MKKAFEGRQWWPEETFQQYLHEKIIMSNKLSLEDEELLEELIDGIPDANLKSQARIQCFIKVSQLAEAFSKIELPKKVVSNKSTTLIPSTSRRAVSSGVAAVQEAKLPRCFNCNALRHFASDCRKPKRV